MTPKATRVVWACCALTLLFASSTVEAADLTLAWVASTGDVAGYRVDVGTSPGSYATNVDVGPRTSARITGLSAGSAYYFVVRAYGSNGALSPPSAEISARVGVASFVTSDFSGDSRSDITVFRPQSGVWYVRDGATAATTTTQWGEATDVPVLGDFNGDGKNDFMVVRPSNGVWAARDAAGPTLTVQWGQGSDVPVPGDYDGDGTTDIAVFRGSTGYWYVRQSTTLALSQVQWGGPQDTPVPADYDGDGVVDVAIYRSSDGTWHIRRSIGSGIPLQWGLPGDVPVPADYDADGKSDLAVYRPSNGTWYFRYAAGDAQTALQWGGAGDIPVPADYDGDGKSDPAVFRRSDATWHVHGSSTGNLVIQWGLPSDKPVVAR